MQARKNRREGLDELPSLDIAMDIDLTFPASEEDLTTLQAAFSSRVAARKGASAPYGGLGPLAGLLMDPSGSMDRNSGREINQSAMDAHRRSAMGSRIRFDLTDGDELTSRRAIQEAIDKITKGLKGEAGIQIVAIGIGMPDKAEMTRDAALQERFDGLSDFMKVWIECERNGGGSHLPFKELVEIAGEADLAARNNSLEEIASALVRCDGSDHKAKLALELALEIKNF